MVNWFFNDPSKHLQELTRFFEYLFAVDMVIGLKKITVLTIATDVFNIRGFIDGLLRYKHCLGRRAFLFVAQFLSNVLSNENKANTDEAVIMQRKRMAEPLLTMLKNLKDPSIDNILQNNMLISSEVIGTYDAKHDNDFPFNYKDVSILPTTEELNIVSGSTTTYRGWLGSNEAVHVELLDRQFRLLRDDFICPLKAERDEIFSSKSRRLRYLTPQAMGVCVASNRGPCVRVRFQLPEGIVKRMESMSNRDIERFLDEEGSRILGRDSIVLFFNNDRDQRIVCIGIISYRDKTEMMKELTSQRSNTSINQRGNPINQKDAQKSRAPVSSSVTVGLWFRDRVMRRLLGTASQNLPFSRFAVVAKSSFFSYEPILTRLQGNVILMLFFCYL